MRRIIVALFLCLLLIGVGIYISVNTSPLNYDSVIKVAQTDNILTNENFINNFNNYINNGFIWDFINVRNFLSWLSVWSLGFVCLFCFFHLLIDKLFFKKFYEEPNIFNAVRRGLFLGLTLVGIVFLRFINGLVWYNVLSIVILFICMEIVFLSIFRKKKPKSNLL